MCTSISNATVTVDSLSGQVHFLLSFSSGFEEGCKLLPFYFLYSKEVLAPEIEMSRKSMFEMRPRINSKVVRSSSVYKPHDSDLI
jgi:hypothetical protein